jgi:hypothetical protein
MKYLKSFDNYITEGLSANIDIDKLLVYIKEKLNFINLVKIGEGYNGIAYIVDGTRKVLKITKDKSEAVESAKIKGKNMKHLADVYNVYSINGEFDGLYVIVLELLRLDNSIEQMSSKLKKIFHNRMDFVESLDEYANDLLSKKRLDSIFKKAAEENLDGFLKQYLDIIDELKANNIKSIDYSNVDNLGFKPDGSLALFDLGYGEEEGMTLAVLERKSKLIK